MSKAQKAKARYYANQAKKGIKQPVSKSSGLAKKPAPLLGSGPLLPGQTRQSEFAGPSLPGQTPGGYYNPYEKSVEPRSTNRSKSSSKSSKPRNVFNSASSDPYNQGVDINQRTNAGKVAGTSDIKLVPGKTRSGFGSDLFKGTTNIIKGAIPGGNMAGEGLKAMGIDFSSLLGIDKALASDTGLSTYQDNEGRYIPDQAQAENIISPQNIQDVLSGGAGPKNITGVTDRPWTDSQGTVHNNNTSTNVNSGTNRDRTPSPVSQPNPYTNPQPTSELSSIIKALVEYRPDDTPTQSNQGTVRRPVGMGEMSTGEFSNGKGGYNFGGGGSVMGGGPQDETNIMNDLLGINTANAQEMMPMNVSDQSNWGNLIDNSGLQKGFESGGLTLDGGGSYVGGFQNNNPVDTTTPHVAPRNTGGAPKGDVTQQFAQGTTGGSQKMRFDDSGFKAQQKAQKKALDELIKSIKNQYKQSTTEGTAALDASKQQDLLKLSGLFNFGANQDPNSEQRLQYEQRTQGDYAGQLKDFLAKISQGQAKDISGAQQGYQSSLADIMQQQSTAKNAYQQQMQQQMAKAQGSPARRATTGAPKSGKVSHKDIFSFVNDSLANGASWDEIANGAAEQGVDTSTGSYLDQLLNNANKQGKWA